MRLKLSLVLVFLLLVVLCAAILSAWDWPVASRLFVVSCSVPGIIFLAIFIVLELIQVRKHGAKIIWQAEQPMDSDGIQYGVNRNEITFFAWIFGFLAGIWLIGFQASAILFTFFYIKFKGRRSWKLSLSLTASMAIVVTGIFTKLLHISWPENVLEIWLGL